MPVATNSDYYAEWKDKVLPTLTPQQRQVAEVLLSGKTLSAVDAIIHYEVRSLSSRVAELKARGLEIKGRIKEDVHQRKFKVYYL